MLSWDLVTMIGLGFVAQLVDGALGMAYGLLATAALLATGAPPALASASVHAAEVVTTGLAGGSHALHRNIDWQVFRRLTPAGVVGGILGAYVLTELPSGILKIVVNLYLLAITALILWRLFTGNTSRHLRALGIAPVGAAGGFLDAIGGGGWGSIVTSTLVARGEAPRLAIGTTSLAEFVVTIAISGTFIAVLDFSAYGRVVLGLVLGGALAAPLAGYLSRILPHNTLMAAVAIVVGTLALIGLARLAV